MIFKTCDRTGQKNSMIELLAKTMLLKLFSSNKLTGPVVKLAIMTLAVRVSTTK